MVYVAVHRDRFSEVGKFTDESFWVVVKSDVSSVVIRTKESFSSYWSHRMQAGENKRDPVVREASAYQKKQLANLLACHPTGANNRTDDLLGEIGSWISDERRCEVEDELDFFDHPEETDYRHYRDDRVQPDTGITEKLTEYRWRKFKP